MYNDIRERLEQGDREDAVFLLECLAADYHGELPEGWVKFLPDRSALERSPVLMRAYAWELAEQSKLSDALALLERSLRVFARQTDLEQMLSAMALCTLIHLRLGAKAEAQTALRFLADELARNEAETSRHPDVLFALSRGGDCVGMTARDRLRLNARAALLYLEQNRGKRCMEALIEWVRLMRLAEGESKESAALEAQLAQRAAWDSSFAVHAAMPQLLGHHQSGGSLDEHWPRLQAELTAPGLPLGPYYRMLLRIAIARASLLFGQAVGAEELPAIRREVQVAFPAELELRAELCMLDFECLTSCGNSAEAEAPLEKLAALSALGLSDGYADWIERCRRRLMQERELVQQQRERKQVQAVEPETLPEPVWRAVCFGGFRLERIGAEAKALNWKRKKAQELFLYLLLRTGHSAPKEQAIDALFGDVDPHKASNQLYVAVHELKRVLHGQLGIREPTLIRDGVVQLPEQYIAEVDIEKFDALIRVADQLHHTDQELSLELYANAAEMYQPLLPQIQFIDWLDRIRDEFERKQAHALRQLYRLSLRCSQVEQAELYCRIWCDAFPLDEEAVQSLIRLLVANGRAAEAKRTFHQFEKTLRRELGASPLPETKALLYRL
jgi:two-component SAPR family response regulator